MSFSGDEWGRPRQPTPPHQQPQPRRGLGAMGCYFFMVAFFAVVTAISFVVSLHSTSPGLGNTGQQGSVGLGPWLLLTLTVLLAIVPLLLRNISRAMRSGRR